MLVATRWSHTAGKRHAVGHQDLADVVGPGHPSTNAGAYRLLRSILQSAEEES